MALLNCLFEEELEALQAIYMDELIITTLTSMEAELQITLHPNTADNDGKKFVCLTLICQISAKYPDEEPKFIIKNPRGISDAHLSSIEENLAGLSLQKVGEVMLFDLLEYAKDSLTDNNHPSCVCPICLELFKEDEQFFRTECYHYFHFPCIKGYVHNNQQEHVCPVCRLKVNEVDVAVIIDHKIKASTKSEVIQPNSYIISSEYKQWLQKCEALYDNQLKNGGIIDLEYEKNKYLIPSEVITPPEEPRTEAVPEESTPFLSNEDPTQTSVVKKKQEPVALKSKQNVSHPKQVDTPSSSGGQGGRVRSEENCECPKNRSKRKPRPHHHNGQIPTKDGFAPSGEEKQVVSKPNRRKKEQRYDDRNKKGAPHERSVDDKRQKNTQDQTSNTNYKDKEHGKSSKDPPHKSTPGPGQHSQKEKSKTPNGDGKTPKHVDSIDSKDHPPRRRPPKRIVEGSKEPRKGVDLRPPIKSSVDSKEHPSRRTHKNSSKDGKVVRTKTAEALPARKYEPYLQQSTSAAGRCEDDKQHARVVRPPPGFSKSQQDRVVRPPPGFSKSQQDIAVRPPPGLSKPAVKPPPGFKLLGN